MRTVQVTYRIQVPTVPNFLRAEDGTTVPIEAITEKGLGEIGREWTDALIKKAKDKKGK